MNKLSLKATGLAAMIAWEFLTVLMLLHQWLLGASEVGAWQILFFAGCVSWLSNTKRNRNIDCVSAGSDLALDFCGDFCVDL